jgi:hypothetical protein
MFLVALSYILTFLHDFRPAGVTDFISGVDERFGQTTSSCELQNAFSRDEIGSNSSSTNLFVDSLMEDDPDCENYDDLKDFIVPKKGRDYSKWLKRRQTHRRRLYSRNLFKRLREKKELLLLLDT